MNATLAVLPSPPIAAHRTMVGFLRLIPALERAGEDALSALAERAELRRIRRGAPLWTAGTTAQEVYWVRSGVAWLSQGGGAGDAREVSIGYFGRGALLGLHPQGSAGLRLDDAVAHEDLAVIVIRRAAFDGWMATWPMAVPAVVGAVAEGVARMQARLAIVGLHGARARLAGMLIELGRTFGVRDSRGVIIDLRLTHRELARLIGATRETVSVSVVEMRNAGWIGTEQRRVILSDLAALQQVADVG